MSDFISDPLLELVKERGLVDDLQFDEVKEEMARSAKTPIQILQDFGILDLDSILQLVADYLGTEVVTLSKVDFTPELLAAIPASSAKICTNAMPISVHGSSIQVAFSDPLNPPSGAGELGFVIRKDVQMVVADPAQIDKAIEKILRRDHGKRFGHSPGTAAPIKIANGKRTRRQLPTTRRCWWTLRMKCPLCAS